LIKYKFKSHLHQILEEELLAGEKFPHQSSGLFRPSEASAVYYKNEKPKIVGSCARKTYYRLTHTPPTDISRMAHQENRMREGKASEEQVTEDAKKAGIYLANNVPFHKFFGDVGISGEIDAVYSTGRCGGVNYVVEQKSIYGYYAQKDIFGRFLHLGSNPGKPRDSYIMQTALYLRYFSYLPKEDPAYLPFGAIYVRDRGDGHFGVFDTWLEPETFNRGGETLTRNHIIYASEKMGVDPTQVPYDVEDILERFQYIQNCVAKKDIPPRDFSIEYTPEQVEEAYINGDISESSYKKWKSSHGPRGKGKEKISDWQCNYCIFSKHCWGTNSPQEDN